MLVWREVPQRVVHRLAQSPVVCLHRADRMDARGDGARRCQVARQLGVWRRRLEDARAAGQALCCRLQVGAADACRFQIDSA